MMHSDWYFAPLLPWQQAAWQRVVAQHKAGRLAHGLLADGVAGIGKRRFVYRLAAYLLCRKPTDAGACGACESCHWLVAGTHPELLALPAEQGVDDAKSVDGSAKHNSAKHSSIKIDDVRQIQEYSQTKGDGLRLIILDGAETLTQAAANALLKTLEEPLSGVHLLLISDNATRLLPTIKSRVQSLMLGRVAYDEALAFLRAEQGCSDELCHIALQVSGLAPLAALAALQADWFGLRKAWVQTLVALGTGRRTPMAAADFWQATLDFGDFMTLSQVMLLEVQRVQLGLPALHTDIDTIGLLSTCTSLDSARIVQIYHKLNELAAATAQNVQEKLAYDALMCVFADA